MKRFLKILNLSINSLAIVCLLLSAYSTFISPEKFVIPSFLSLVFLPLLLINVLFVAFWIVELKWFFVLSLASIILTYGNFKNTLPFKSKEKSQFTLNDSTQFTLLSYNVKLFDFYKKNNKLENLNKTLAYIIEEDADVVCLQEFGYLNAKAYLNDTDIFAIMAKKYKYKHVQYNMNPNRFSTYGVATFSKYPMVNNRRLNYKSKFNLTICSDILIGNKTVHLFNCHLESNQLTLDDRKKMSEVVDNNIDQEKIKGTTGLLLRKLGTAYKRRAHQADIVADAINEYDSSVIVCGDFNDSPVSYTYTTVKGDLVDVFINSSSGLGITYNELPFLFRIDYILHSKNLSSGKFKIDKVRYSDHYPISCVIDLENKRTKK